MVLASGFVRIVPFATSNLGVRRATLVTELPAAFRTYKDQSSQLVIMQPITNTMDHSRNITETKKRKALIKRQREEEGGVAMLTFHVIAT